MAEAERKIRVGVVFGGRSAEYEVSLKSAKAVIAALDPAKYEVALLGISQEGRWMLLGERGTAPVEPAQLMEAAASSPHVTIVGDPSTIGLAKIEDSASGMTVGGVASFNGAIDVIFPVLHGPYGEDGTLQGLLEMANIPYVGAGVLASAAGMDKAVQKEIFRAAGIPVIDYYLLKRRDWEATATNEAARTALLGKIEASAPYPCFVKPVNMGSSVGVGRAVDREALIIALENAARFDRKIIIERGVRPRELEVAVLGNDEPEASVVGELAHQAVFYDYTAKYIDSQGMSFYIPAQISTELSDRIRNLAIKAYLALDCAGMTRVDFFLDQDSNELYLNEVNTIPGFTSLSMYPMLWEASGLTYPQLVDRLISLALERHADKNRNQIKAN